MFNSKDEQKWKREVRGKKHLNVKMFVFVLVICGLFRSMSKTVNSVTYVPLNTQVWLLVNMFEKQHYKNNDHQNKKWGY